MFIVKYSGGLGNQMYQYALQSLLRELYPNTEIKADITHYSMIEEHNGFEIESVFDTTLEYATNKEIKKISCGFVPGNNFNRLPFKIRNSVAHRWQFVYKDFKTLFSRKKRQRTITDRGYGG